MENFSAVFDFLVVSVFSELFAVYFLLGFVIFLVGVLLLVLFVLSRTLGYRTTGTVVGAVELTRIKRKERDGKTVEKLKKSLYPVFEYTTTSGTERQMRASEGGTGTLSYTTGQTVNLIVREDEDYDDVYDADRTGILYFGLAITALGIALMSWIGTAIAAAGISVSIIVMVLLALLVRGLVTKFTSDSSQPTNTTKRKREPYNKDFDPADLHPVEYFKT